LLIIGSIAKVAIIWTIGFIVVVVGAILALLGDDRPCRPRPEALLLSRADL